MMNRWSRVIALAVLIAAVGCGEGAKLIQDGADGGVVAYPFKGEQGSMLSSFRKDALSLILQKCNGPFVILREGETKGRSRIVGAFEGTKEIVQERRWGIEFRCK